MLRLLPLLLLLFSDATLAQSVAAPNAFDRFMELSTGSGKQTIGFGSNGTPVLSPGVPTVTADGGLPRVDASGSIRNPSGNTAAVTATSRIPAAEVGKAVGRAALKISASLAFVGTGLALYDLAKELGFDLSRNADGSLKVLKPDPAACTSQCVEVRYTVGSFKSNSASPASSCSAAASGATSLNAAGGGTYIIYTYTGVQPDGERRCLYTVKTSSGADYGTGSTPAENVIQVEPTSAPAAISTIDALKAAAAFKSGWDAASAVPRLIAEDNPPAGQKIQTTSPVVTGVATSPGTSTTTNNTTNNTTKTETTTHNHTYQGNTVTTSNVIVSTTINNSTGAVTDSTTTASTPPAPAPSPEPAITCGLPGTPACKLDEADTPSPVAVAEYPDKLAKLESDSAAAIPKIATAEDKSFFEPLRSLFVLPSVASCQPFVLPRNMGAIDPCPVADGMRLVMGYIWALGALFLSLRMIREVI